MEILNKNILKEVNGGVSDAIAFGVSEGSWGLRIFKSVNPIFVPVPEQAIEPLRNTDL